MTSSKLLSVGLGFVKCAARQTGFMGIPDLFGLNNEVVHIVRVTFYGMPLWLRDYTKSFPCVLSY